MRDKVRAVLHSTWLTAKSNFDTELLTPPLMDADRAWVAKNKKWVQPGDLISPYIKFALNAIHEVHGIPFPKLTEKKQLRDVLGPAGVKQLEDEVVQFMESLPRKYIVDIPIRVATPLGEADIKLTRSISLANVEREAPQPQSSLVGLGSQLGALSQLGGLFAAATAMQTPPAKPRGTAFRIKVVGYLDGSSSDSAAEAALATLRQFMALSLATGDVQRTNRLDVTFNARKARAIDLTESSDARSTFQLPSSAADFLEKLTISEAAFRLPSAREMTSPLARALVGFPVPEPQRAQVVKENLDVITRVLDAHKNDGRNLQAAAEWLFDSEAERNETTALLYASIGLEAVLDAPANDVTARLGDRLAWLLGRSRKERLKLADEHRDFYTVRSGLVHGRERTLDDKGRQKLRWGRETLRLIIARELQQWPKEPKIRRRRA